MARKNFRWATKPSKMGREFNKKVVRMEAGLRVLASTHAARGDSIMKAGASWTDRTTFARSSLYGRAEGLTIYLGTTNDEYGRHLELGTIYMAARPIIVPTMNEVAQQYFSDSLTLIRGILGGR